MEKTVLRKEKIMTAQLFVATGVQVQTYAFAKDMTVGRKTDRNVVDIYLPYNFVSRNHGVFGTDANGYYYMDTGSSNGSIYNGSKIEANQKQYLSNGDTIQIARRKNTAANELVSMVFTRDYPEQYEWVALTNLDDISDISIGRGKDNNLDMGDKAISVNHACFFEEDGVWNIEDYNSTNGVFVNGNKIVGKRELQVGDCIRIVNIHFVFKGNSFIYQKNNSIIQDETSGEVLSIQIVERSVWQRAKKLMLLKDINMNIRNGELVLVLGGSGAGKSTFMNAVMGYEKAKGKVTHDGVDVYKNFKSIKHKIGFVPQLDLMRGKDTVYDTLSNAAEMKLPENIEVLERIARIEKVLNTLGLSRERKSLVSKLSGGQRKRLSIAIEYVSDPSLFFLDEPDSGLDGIMARTLMQNLRTIADEGKIVMVISHGPDRVAHLFDKIIVLAKSEKDNCGHLAFFGDVDSGIAFFGSETLEGIVQRINRVDEGGDGLSDYYIEKYKQFVEGDM